MDTTGAEDAFAAGFLSEFLRTADPESSLEIGVSVTSDCITIKNGEDENFIVPRKKVENWFSVRHGLVDGFVVLYSGNFGFHHGLEILLDAAELIKRERVEFLLIGEGNQKVKLIQKARTMNLRNIRFLPFQSTKNLPFTMTCGDVVVVSQLKGTEGLCVVGKFYTALAAGKSILAIIGEESEIARVVKKYNCGLVVSNSDAKAIAAAILRMRLDPDLRESMGKNSRRVLEENFTRKHAIGKYYNMLINIS